MTALEFSLGDAQLLPWLLVGAVAFAAAVLGGLAGYGTGLILPVVLAPLVGVINVVPVLALAMLMANASRVAAFWRDVHWLQVRRVLLLGVPACMAGAYAYTLLDARWIALLIGAFLLASIPLRRALARSNQTLGACGQVGAGAAYGGIDGAMTGTGVLLISLLMASGVQGAALIGTDAVISALLGVFKVAVFGGFDRLDGSLAIIGALVGLCTLPGAFVARRLLTLIPARVHAFAMEGVVVIGGAAFLWRAWQ